MYQYMLYCEQLFLESSYNMHKKIYNYVFHLCHLDVFTFALKMMFETWKHQETVNPQDSSKDPRGLPTTMQDG